MFEYAILIEGSNSTTNTSTRIKRLKESKQGRMADALSQVPEAIDKYPEVKTFGPKIPAYGVWARHVKGVKLKNVTFELKNPDARPEIICEDGDIQIYK